GSSEGLVCSGKPPRDIFRNAAVRLPTDNNTAALRIRERSRRTGVVRVPPEFAARCPVETAQLEREFTLQAKHRVKGYPVIVEGIGNEGVAGGNHVFGFVSRPGR